jgi:primosomal protein N' (replication factor Y)
VYKYAGIIVNNEAVQLDRVFTYSIPESLQEKLKIGMRVKVPFGRGNSVIDGFVLELFEHCQEDVKYIKNISSLCHDLQLFNVDDIELIKFMRERYLCSYLDGIKTIIPTGTIKGVSSKLSEVIIVSKRLEGNFDKEPYKKIYEVIEKYNGMYNRSQINKEFGISLSSINTLLKHGFLKKEVIIVDRFNSRSYVNYSEKLLNEEQKKVVESILYSEEKIFLLQGVTGSGKTEVYMHLVSKMLESDRQSIILVPEISLTPQMVERFKGRFGSQITVFHSKLSDGERYDEWMRVKLGKVKLAIGARSAIFLPFDNLGLIVIDEEHEYSYKADSNPKYDAREVAEFKSKLLGCKVVLGTATPSLETAFRSRNQDIVLLNMKNRVDNAKMPAIEVVDMRQELIQNNRSIFSKTLYSYMKEALMKKEQVILFLNRRGFSTFVSCRQCGYVFKCDKCDIAMTYHQHNDSLGCHYCGASTKVSKTCPKCGSSYVKYFGAGTERIEAEIKKYFPSSSVLRMDFDTTRKKDAYENIYTTFKNGEADILVGTQMIAKGLDFPNVTVVGVLAADLTLNLPDYKSAERTFQLMTQVSGRAGRGDKEGRVVIQTYSPEHYSIIHSKDGDYEAFYSKEIDIRKDMNYPPYSQLLLLNFSSKNEQLLIKVIQDLGIKIKDFLKNSDIIDVLGPCPCSISKIKESYRWQIILKGKLDSSIATLVKDMVFANSKDYYNDVKISLDMNPNSLI